MLGGGWWGGGQGGGGGGVGGGGEGGGGGVGVADVVIFGTCLYVGAAAFLRKFQVSCFGMKRIKNWVLLEQKKNLLQLKKRR